MPRRLKIFISHSSQDRWVARRVAEDLEALGCETFLDEKDLETGTSIDAAIRKHLASSNDFLILLTPASVRSEWVLVELGGALALRKNVIPVMLYVGINELPKAIALTLARGITDLDKYYAEIAKRLGKTIKSVPPSTTRNVTPALRDRRFRRGQHVRIVHKRPKDHAFAGWVDDMDEFLGQPTRIREVVSPDSTFSVYRIDIDNGEWLWLGGWLIPQNARRRL